MKEYETDRTYSTNEENGYKIFIGKSHDNYRKKYVYMQI
jgi:hypothetical protein